jgi:SAM-dependent methyltransferase
MRRSLYDLLYRVGAPWDGPPRANLVRLVETGLITPARLSPGRAIDLGCGTGANVRYLADHGFEAVGVDYSRVALEIARKRSAVEDTPTSARFIEGDLTADRLSGAEGPFDLILDFGTLDDLDAGGRRAMARLVASLARPGAIFLFWCFWARRSALPRLSISGPSRMVPVIEPGEEADLFGDTFSIERLAEPDASTHTACFLMTRRWPSPSSPRTRETP